MFLEQKKMKSRGSNESKSPNGHRPKQRIEKASNKNMKLRPQTVGRVVAASARFTSFFPAVLMPVFVSALTSFFTTPIYSSPWRIQGIHLDAAELQLLNQRYPEITESRVLSNLMLDIAEGTPLNYLTSKKVSGVWVVVARSADAISKIEFETPSTFLKTKLLGSSHRFLNAIDSHGAQLAIIESSKLILKDQGFPLAVINIRKRHQDGRLIYSVRVDERDPCTVTKIEFTFQIPNGIDFQVSPGDLCQIAKINREVDELEEQIRSLGYTQLKISHDKVAVLDGILRIRGTLGQRIEYFIKDSAGSFLFENALSQKDIVELTPAIVSPEAMNSELKKRYQSQGFVDVNIKTTKSNIKNENTTIYTYQISPGIKYSLSDVLFDGANVISKKEMLKIMAIETVWQASNPLDIEKITSGMDALRARYQTLGYWDVKIWNPRIAKNPELGTANLAITINEGKQRKFEGINFTGLQFFERKRIETMLPLAKGDAVDKAILLKFEEDLRGLYVETGFLYASIDLKVLSKKKRRFTPTIVNIDIREGPRTKFGSIKIIGLTETKQKVIGRELTIKTGDWYRPSQINISRKKLVDLGIFSSIQIMPVSRNSLIEEQKNIDIAIRVREGNSGTVAFGPGYDLYRGLSYSAENNFNNIGGVGRRFSMRASLSQEKQQVAIDNKTLVGRKFGIGYVEPYLFGLPIDVKLSWAHKATADSFWKISQSGEVALIHAIKNPVSSGTVGELTAFYGQKISKEEGATVQENIGITTENLRTGKAGFRTKFDWRNSKTWPTDGSLMIANVAWARYNFGGDLRFFRWELINNYYFKMPNNFVFAIGGAITSFSNIARRGSSTGTLPGADRLNSGGPDMVRGYHKQLGPYIRSAIFNSEKTFAGYETTVIGGDRRVVIKTELRYRLSDLIGISLFLDSGNAFLSTQQSSVFKKKLAKSNSETDEKSTLEDNISYEFSDIFRKPGYLISRNYHAFGTAWNILTPIGSINLAYAWPWKEPKSQRCRDDSSLCLNRSKEGKDFYYRGKFELSIGSRF